MNARSAKSRRVLILGGFCLVAVGFAIAAALYGRLPDPVPSHWSAHGVADGFMRKPWGAFVLPLGMAGLWLVLLMLPRISPEGFALDRFPRTYTILGLSTLASLLLFEIAALRAAIVGGPLGGSLPALALGGLCVVMGNFFGKVTRNFFLGIRTPWTLASEEVWNQTHRLAGKLYVVAGLATILLGFFCDSLLPAVVLVLGASLIAVVYSYLAYTHERKLTKE